MSGHEGSDRREIHATVFHRTGSRVKRRLDDVVDELDDLVRASTVAAHECRAWPDAVPMDRPSTPLRIYRRVNDWAERNDVSVEPPFRIAAVSSSILHVSDEVLRTPEICLTFRRAGELWKVFPHTTEDDVVTVRDGLDRIASRVPPDTESSERAGDGREPALRGGDGAPTL